MAIYISSEDIYNYIKIHCGYDIHPLRSISYKPCINDECDGHYGKVNIPGTNGCNYVYIPCDTCFNAELRSGKDINDNDELTCGGLYKFPYINKKGFSNEEKFVENYKYILHNPHILRDDTIVPEQSSKKPKIM
jgi:hypothetical protein